MKFKNLLTYERIGLLNTIEKCLYPNTNLFPFGITDKNLINFNITIVDKYPIDYPYLTGLGLTESEDIILRFTDRTLKKYKHYTISFFDLINPFTIQNEKNPVSKMKEIEVY